MYSVSNLFKQYMVQSDREFEIKAVVGLTTYDWTSVIEFEIEDSVIPSEEFTLGTVISSRLTISIMTTDTLPTNAKISPFVRLNGISGYTEWVPLGSYYIDSRTYENTVWKFTCFDKLILSQQLFISSLVYPISMAQVFEELCGQLGYVVDPSVVINPAYMIPYKDEEITMREMLGYIASAHAASIRLTKDEQLTFVTFGPGTPPTTILASDYFKANETNPLKTYTALKLTYNTNGETLTAGSGDSDHTMSLYNPFMDQGILDTVMATVNGFSYMPFTMEWRGRPDLEIGDAITVSRRDGTTFLSTILTNKALYKGGLKTTSTAPSYSPQRSETDYKGSIKQQLIAVAKNGLIPDEPYYGVTIGRLNGLKVERSDGITKSIFNSDLIRILKNSEIIFDVNLDGNLVITGIMHMLLGSSIDWNIVVPPTAGQIGAKDINWKPEINDVNNLAGMLTHIDGNGIYTGTLTAQQINIIQGLDLDTEVAAAQTQADSAQATANLATPKTDITNGLINFLISGTNKISVNSNFYWDASGFYAVNGLKVVKITAGGIGIGVAGVGGAFATAMTGDGIVAEKIMAGLISGVSMSLGGLNNVTGTLSVKNASAVEVVKIDNLGILVTHTTANSQTSLQGDGFKIVKTTTGEVIASITGTDLGFSSLTVGAITSPSVQNIQRGNLTYYVNSATGLDSNTGLASGTAFKTIMKAINILSNILEDNASVTIYIAAGTYNENVVIRNFSGGSITLRFPAATTTTFINGYILVQDCTTSVFLVGGRTTYNTADGTKINYATYDIVLCSRSKYVEVVGFVIIGSYGVSGSGNGVCFDSGTVGYVYHCDISRTNDAIVAGSGSIVTTYDNCGSNNGAGLVANYSGVINVPTSSWCPTGGSNTYVQMGGRIVLEGTVAYAASIANPPAAPPITTTSWAASLTDSYRVGVGWNGTNNDVYQGKYTGSAYNCYTGCMWFSGFIAAVVTTVKSARLYLSRYSYGGSSAAQNLYLRGVTETGVAGGCTIIKDYGWIGALAWNQSSWFTLPNQAIIDYNAGTIGGLALYDGDPNYTIIAGYDTSWPPVLEVTYT